jgi:hypothetical protein
MLYMLLTFFYTPMGRWLVYQEPLQDEHDFHDAHVVPVVKQVLDVVAQSERAHARDSKENNPRNCVQHGRAREDQVGMMSFKESVEIDAVKILRSSATKGQSQSQSQSQSDLNSRGFEKGFGSQKAAHAEGSRDHLHR